MRTHRSRPGNLPTLVKNGYNGPIYTTPASADLCVPMLTDSAHLQEMDAIFVNKRRSRKRLIDPAAKARGPVEPLYTTEDAEKTFPLFRQVPMHTPTEVGPGLTYSTVDAGHMLGSTSIVLEVRNGGKPLRIGFSGDIGRPGLPIIRDPEPMPAVDYLIMESTYGDRLHQDLGSVKDKFADIVSRTAARGGKIIVPSFAVGRTQQIVLVLHQLTKENCQIPSIPVFVDSPLAVNVTEVFRKHKELFDDETAQFLTDGEDPFGFSRLRYIRDVNESKALNDLRGPFHGDFRVRHVRGGSDSAPPANDIENPRNTVLSPGFQAENL